MKKLILISLIAFTLSSCDKIIDEIKKNITPFKSTVDLSFDLPENIDVNDEYSIKEENKINIKEIIEENLNESNIGIEDFSEIKIAKITFNIENADEENNWTNLEALEANFNTSKGLLSNKPSIYASISISDEESERFSDKVIEFDDNNILEYFDNEELTAFYELTFKTRNSINKNLKLNATVEFSFKP